MLLDAPMLADAARALGERSTVGCRLRRVAASMLRRPGRFAGRVASKCCMCETLTSEMKTENARICECTHRARARSRPRPSPSDRHSLVGIVARDRASWRLSRAPRCAGRTRLLPAQTRGRGRRRRCFLRRTARRAPCAVAARPFTARANHAHIFYVYLARLGGGRAATTRSSARVSSCRRVARAPPRPRMSSSR